MKVGLLLNSSNRLDNFSEKYLELLKINSIPYILIDPNSYYLFDEIKTCTHLLFRHSQGDTDIKIYDSIFNIAHNTFNINCSPNFETYWQYEDKIKEYYLLKSHDFPIIDFNVFWNYSHAESFLKSTKLPIVVKLPKGASSENVVMVKTVDDGTKIINQVFGKGVKSKGINSKSNLFSFSNSGFRNYTKSLLKSNLKSLGLLQKKDDYAEWQIQKDAIIFQKYLPNNSFDTRVTVIGKRALAFRRFVRKNDFRASGSGNFDMSPENIDLRCIEISFAISKKLNFSTMAYDFIYDEHNTPHINEISYCFVDWIVERCPGYWDESLLWHDAKNWPQYYQISDFLQIEDLKPLY